MVTRSARRCRNQHLSMARPHPHVAASERRRAVEFQMDSVPRLSRIPVDCPVHAAISLAATPPSALTLTASSAERLKPFHHMNQSPPTSEKGKDSMTMKVPVNLPKFRQSSRKTMSSVTGTTRARSGNTISSRRRLSGLRCLGLPQQDINRRAARRAAAGALRRRSCPWIVFPRGRGKKPLCLPLRDCYAWLGRYRQGDC